LLLFLTSRVTPLPRNHGSNFEQHKTAFEEGAGKDDAMIEDVNSPEKDNPGSDHDIKLIEIEKV
jgi:SHS family lactate transporter-like MFS transporter